MKTFESIQNIRAHLSTLKHSGKHIGLVPTMGALHNGHLSLIEKSQQQNDITVCSIFVNPTQFNDLKDLEKYPKTIDADSKLLQDIGCDVLFSPQVSEMYPDDPTIKLSFGELESTMEGASRPGHFNGVGIVISKLFNIVQPNKAYFGQKDLQQVTIIKNLVKQLNYPIEIITCPILREENGLAMSSRNTRLSADDRAFAGIIFETLSFCMQSVETDSIQHILQKATGRLENSRINIEYISCINLETFQPTSNYIKTKTAFCIAAQIGGVRLIDNVIV